MTKSVYIHIPFCENKCHYCDFNSYIVNGQPVADYLKALELEMDYTLRTSPASVVDTIFIGGGTPTVLSPKELEVLLTGIRTYFPNLSDNYEFTVEANPGTVNYEKLKVMKNYGVNRISMGVQAFQDDLLAYIGRIHKEKDVFQSIENAIKAGFSNISIDLMFGLPNQTVSMLEESLSKAFALDLPHFSVYSLKVEENTLFHTLYENKTLPLPTDKEDLAMFELAMGRMRSHGYHQYEISNFSKKGYESLHNMNYWKNGDYYGFGAGAHGYIHRIRHSNIKGINPYIQKILIEKKLPRVDEYQVSIEEKMEDMLMLGLRLLDGVSKKEFYNEFGMDLHKRFGAETKKLIKLGLIQEDKNVIKLTDKGIIYGNEVFAEFISL